MSRLLNYTYADGVAPVGFELARYQQHTELKEPFEVHIKLGVHCGFRTCRKTSDRC
jgi:hypothetical protein